MSKTQILVGLFLALLAVAAYQEASAGPRIALGHTLINSHQTYGEFGFEYESWEVAGAQHGNGDADTTDIISLSRIVRPGWNQWGAAVYLRLGGAYIKNSSLVGDTNYRLGLGIEHRIVAIEFFHYSSANIHEPNTGIDGVQVRWKIPY